MNFGIIGCGMISSIHAKAIEAITEAKLIGVYDTDAEKRDSFAFSYGVKSYSDIDSILHDQKTDAVCICTPSGYHAENAVKAIEAGKHVLIEKPLALNTSDCDRIIEAATKYGVTAGVVSQLRFSPVIDGVKTVIDNGSLGKIVTGDLFMKYYRSKQYYSESKWRGTWKHDGGGALMNQGIHGVDMLLYLMGEVKCVYGMARTLAHNIEVEDTVSAVLEFANGALGVVQGTTSVYPGYPRKLTVSGTQGTVGMTEDRITEWNVMDLKKPDEYMTDNEIKSGAQNPENIAVEGHILQIRDFIDAVKNGRQPKVGLADGRRTVKLITSVYEASRTNIPVELRK